MVDMFIMAAGYGGMIGALLWLGIVPYMEKRKEAELAGTPVPTFAGAYMTNFVIAVISGFITVTMTVSGLEEQLASVQSTVFAAGVGFAFTYTVLGITNSRTEAKIEVAEVKAKTKVKEIIKDRDPTSPAPII